MGSESDAETSSAEPKPDSTVETEREKPAAETEPSGAGAASNGESSSESSDEKPAEAPEAPRKKKKKKKKRAEAGEPEPPRERGPVYGPDGSERPAFVLDFPEDPELEKVTAAFEAGNYKYVREHATELAERSENAAVKRAATELLTRIEPDPLIRFLLGVSVVLLLFLTYYAYANHGH